MSRTLRTTSPPLDGKLWYERGKRLFDVLFCLLFLPVVLVIVLLCALAVRIESPGPIFFGQRRTGKDGKRFRMWKFRTMVANAEELKQELTHLNVLTPPDFKIPNDPRITRVGKFLRMTSLDEFPQILNVLRGEMSLVGPRPTSFHPSTYELWHTRRLEVKPGITGLWQISGRSKLNFDERLRIDSRYIVRRSFLFDFTILLRTISAVFSREGE